MEKAGERGFICLAVGALIGDALLILKFAKSTVDSCLGLLLALLLSVAAVVLLKKVCSHLEKRGLTHKLNKGWKLFVLLSLLLFLLVLSVFTLYSFARYAAEVMLSAKDIFLPFVSMALLALFLGLSRDNTVFKLSVIVSPAVIIFTALMFAFSVQFMSLKYIIPRGELTIASASTFLPLFFNLSATAVPLLIVGGEYKAKSFPVSSITVGVLILVCAVNVMAIFGSELASGLSYPYSSAVSTASMGEIFSRLDGFFYASCFFTVLLKEAVCILAIKKIVRKIFKLYY